MTSAFITFPFLTNPDSIRETIILRGNRAAKIFSTQEAAVNYCKSMNLPECSADGVQWDWEELEFHG